MKEGKTKSGFFYSVDDDVMDNMELVEALADATGDNPLAIAKVTEMIFGKEQKKRLYDHLRNEKGRVKVSSVMKIIEEVFGAFGQQGKNS